RIALTTAGFLPISFVLLLVLYAGQTVLYPWVTKPIPAKAGWLNVPFFWLRTYACAAVLFAVCFAFVRALLRDAIPPDDERERAHRNRVAVILLMLWLVTVSLWGFDLLMSLDPKWYSGLFGGYFAVSTLYTAFCLLAMLTVRTNARGRPSIPPAAVPRRRDHRRLPRALRLGPTLVLRSSQARPRSASHRPLRSASPGAEGPSGVPPATCVGRVT